MLKKEVSRSTAKCTITGRPKKSPDVITPAEQDYAETCRLCGFKAPWGGPIRLRGRAGLYICDNCDDNYFDEETRGEKQ